MVRATPCFSRSDLFRVLIAAVLATLVLAPGAFALSMMLDSAPPAMTVLIPMCLAGTPVVGGVVGCSLTRRERERPYVERRRKGLWYYFKRF